MLNQGMAGSVPALNQSLPLYAQYFRAFNIARGGGAESLVLGYFFPHVGIGGWERD